MVKLCQMCWYPLGQRKVILNDSRGGSLPEILNYLPDGGQFSRVPVLIQVQVFKICVRQIVRYYWK